MQTQIIHRLVLATTAIILTIPGAFANLISNGDFQTGDFTSWTQYTTGNGTIGGNGSFGLPAVVSYDTTGAGASLAAKLNVGAINACCNPEGGGIRQNFNAPGTGTYSFFAAIASENDANGLINGDPGTFSFLVDGVLIGSQQLFGFSTAHEIVRGTLSVTTSVSAGNHTLSVQVLRSAGALGPSTPTQFLDNINVTQVSAATPEPGTLALLFGGFAALGLAKFRQKR